MRQVGVDEVSMKQVALRADVSLSTVYNLFESKEDVVGRVFNQEYAKYLAAVDARASTDPLQRFFDAVDIAGEFYTADEPFYRSSIWLVDADSSYKLSLQKPRFGFFRNLVSEATDAGILRSDTDAYVLGLMVVPMFSAPYQAWAGGWVSIDEFRARAKLGICIVLEGFAAPGHRARFDALLPTFEDEVKRHRELASGKDRGDGLANSGPA